MEDLMSKRRITVIKGDGIGPSITDATLKVLDALNCDFEYDFAQVGISCLVEGKPLIPEEVLDLIRKNKVTLKGPLTTPIGEGFTSINVTLRKTFELFANVRPAISFPGTKSRYDNIDIITVRENMQGMYSGKGQIVTDDGKLAQAMSIYSKDDCLRIIDFAYNIAKKNNRKKITIIHKANILKTTSGLFLQTGREIAKKYPEIETNEMIVDNACMQLVMNPHQFDVIVTTNLFGDIISDLCAGLVGGLGMAPGANIGKETAIFEAVHGSAPDIAHKNIANPTALFLAAAIMLDYLDMADKAKKIRDAIREVTTKKDRVTIDLGGNGSTDEYTSSIIERL